MLFTYHYPTGHALEVLNEHLFQFLTSIKTVSPRASFNLNNYLNEDFKIIVERSPILKEKLQNFFFTFRALDQTKKDLFYQAILKSQNIEDFFSDITIMCDDIMTPSINNIIGNNSFEILMSHLFKVTLKGLGIHSHYKNIYDSMPHKVCPFCGVEKMHKSFQEDYDHLSAKKHYPTLAINMRNLAPMCHTCNSKNKGETDVLHDQQGVRRLFIYPYTKFTNIDIDFSDCIIPYSDIANIEGNWNIKILPDNAITRDWDEIFKIKKRYKEDYLEANYEDWLEDFLDGLVISNIIIRDEDDVIYQLNLWSQTLSHRKFYNFNFIKAPLFQYLANCGLNALYTSIIIRYNQKISA